MNKFRACFYLFGFIFLIFFENKSFAQEEIRIQKKLDSMIQLGNELILSNPKNAIELGLRSVALAESLADYTKLQKSYSILRNSYFYYGLMEEASYYSSKNFQIAQEFGTDEEEFFAKVNQGGIWLVLGKNDKAKEIFVEALAYMESQPINLKDSTFAASMTVILNNLSVSETNLGNFESAKNYADRGLEIAKKNQKIPQEYVRIINNYADILQKLQRFEEAEGILNEALEISKTIKSPVLEATTLYSLARLHLRNNELDQAVLLASMSFELARKIENLSLEGAISTLLYEEFDKLNMPDSALKYRRIQKKVDSLAKYNSANELMLKVELQNEFKKTMAEVQKNETNQRFFFLLVLVSALLIISVLIYFFFKAKEKAQKSLVEQKKSEELVIQKKGEVEILETALKEKKAELSLQSIKKLEKDRRIEELLKRLLSEPNSPVSEKIDIEKELNDYRHSLKEFDLIFTDVHSGFITKLQSEFPKLTLNERRMCAMLKLQLTTKEISQITHQSIRSIEITRIRLRKKLNLTNQSIRISDFLASY